MQGVPDIQVWSGLGRATVSPDRCMIVKTTLRCGGNKEVGEGAREERGHKF